jgi:hypothetical protein
MYVCTKILSGYFLKYFLHQTIFLISDMGAMADQKPEGAGETPPHSSEDEAITKVRTLDIPTKLETVRSNVPVKLQINIGMKGSEVIDACAKFANKNISISKVIDTVHR